MKKPAAHHGPAAESSPAYARSASFVSFAALHFLLFLQYPFQLIRQFFGRFHVAAYQPSLENIEYAPGEKVGFVLVVIALVERKEHAVIFVLHQMKHSILVQTAA